MTLPVLPMVMPSDLAGRQNGRLPSTMLVSAGIPGRDWVMHPLAARAMKAMVAAATAAGIQVRATGTYRSFDRQLSLFVSRYEPCSYTTYLATPSTRRKQWPEAGHYGYSSQWWRKRLINGSYPATAAVPGRSNHGWALAVDFAQELDGDPDVESVSSAFVSWLVGNAHRFGYSAELQSEPWHWRYIAGDAVPQAVLDFERGKTDPAVPAPVVRLGSTGPNVVDLQNHLKFWNLYPYAVDGSAGPRTVEAIQKLQTNLKVSPVDGVYGSQTAAAYKAWLISLAAG